jgi:hypothetical protein
LEDLGVDGRIILVCSLETYSPPNILLLLSSFLGSTARLRPWSPPQNSAEFLGGFSTIFFFTG